MHLNLIISENVLLYSPTYQVKHLIIFLNTKPFFIIGEEDEENEIDRLE